jgi:hypothetical protein
LSVWFPYCFPFTVIQLWSYIGTSLHDFYELLTCCPFMIEQAFACILIVEKEQLMNVQRIWIFVSREFLLKYINGKINFSFIIYNILTVDLFLIYIIWEYNFTVRHPCRNVISNKHMRSDMWIILAKILSLGLPISHLDFFMDHVNVEIQTFTITSYLSSTRYSVECLTF